MALMRKMYTELFTLNNELIGEYTKRSNNHQVCERGLSYICIG